MPKKVGIIFVSMGAVLILSALLLFFHNKREAQRAGQEAELLLNSLQTVLTEQEVPEEKELSPEMPVVMIDGYGYIGYLSIPELELELPVMSEWDYARLKIAPCRQCGSSRTDDLVIAAHNYETHFGSLSDLEAGAAILFTDMEGVENHYRLDKLETLDPEEDEAVEAVLESEYPLVLYTCTTSGAARVTAFCQRVEG